MQDDKTKSWGIASGHLCFKSCHFLAWQAALNKLLISIYWCTSVASVPRLTILCVISSEPYALQSSNTFRDADPPPYINVSSSSLLLLGPFAHLKVWNLPCTVCTPLQPLSLISLFSRGCLTMKPLVCSSRAGPFFELPRLKGTNT